MCAGLTQYLFCQVAPVIHWGVKPTYTVRADVSASPKVAQVTLRNQLEGLSNFAMRRFFVQLVVMLPSIQPMFAQSLPAQSDSSAMFPPSAQAALLAGNGRR